MKLNYLVIPVVILLCSCRKESVTISPKADTIANNLQLAQTDAVVYPPYTVRTIAGVFEAAGSEPHLADGYGPVARFWKPHGLTVTGDGNIYVADFLNNAIRKITTQNKVYTLPLSANGQANGGLLPEAVGVSNDGTLYIVSTGYSIRIYNQAKGIDVYDRIANSDSNLDIEKDTNGVMWFVSDYSLGRIINTKIQRNIISFAGLLAPNEVLRGIGVGSGGVKYVSTATKLFKVDSKGVITRLFINQNFTFISGIAVTRDGSKIYIADGNAIKMIYQNVVTTIAKPGAGDGKDGLGLAADVVAANLALANSEKALFVSDTRNTIRKITLP